MKATCVAGNNINYDIGYWIINDFIDLICVIIVLIQFSVATVLKPRVKESGFRSNKAHLNAVHWIRENIKSNINHESAELAKLQIQQNENVEENCCYIPGKINFLKNLHGLSLPQTFFFF